MILINFCKESHRYQSVKQNKSLASFSVCFVKQKNLGIGLRFDLLESNNPFKSVLLSFTEKSKLSLWIACGMFQSKSASFWTLSRFVHPLPIFWQRTLITFWLLKDLPLVVLWLFINSLFLWFNVHVCIDKPIFLNHMNVF